MIIKASQRGGAQCLARHLLNANDNEHVEVHQVSGFVSESLPGALQEAYAISRGTRCRQFLFSVSLSPPQGEQVPIETFEETVKQIEARLGLEGQPRLIVFHEKNARRHAHAVWSRIDSDNMKAIHLPFFKNKLMEISKEMYLEQNWKLPKGFISRENRNPLNFTQEQWQQAKRLGDDPKQIKTALKECWSASATKDAFRKALERNGYYLAQGDRRGFVAVDWRGEVYSLSRWLDTKGKDLKAHLGEEKELPSVDETKTNIDRQLAESMKKHLANLQEAYQKKLAPLLAEKTAMTQRHRSERARLADQHSKRCDREQQERQDRYRKGFMGL
tara:strand:- start:145262 stop:146254 length:993 start_codon:yes stop_codon:yes gene_type:complete